MSSEKIEDEGVEKEETDDSPKDDAASQNQGLGEVLVEEQSEGKTDIQTESVNILDESHIDEDFKLAEETFHEEPKGFEAVGYSDVTSEEHNGTIDTARDVEETSGITMHSEAVEEEKEMKGPEEQSSKSDAVSHVSADRRSVIEYQDFVENRSLDDLQILTEEQRESMFTQAGSYRSTSSSSQVKSDDETLPKNFQDYVKRYSALFTHVSGQEEIPCDEGAGKTFLKIDLNELISGYRSEDKMCREAKAALSGMTRVRHDLICIENESIVLRKDYKTFKGVRILSGGHMGNEPLYIDYVGRGLLTGAVLGTVCDPPSVASVTKAMRELANGAPGLLIIIMNNVEYRLIFGLAMERIRMEGFINIDMVTVGDDCFERCKSPVGRRGLVGIILLFKIAGAMAEDLKCLREIYITIRTASKSIVTISCMTKPFKAVGTGLDKNSRDGVNFNGDTYQLIKKMLDYCVHPLRYFSMRVNPEDSIIVLINSYRTKTPEFYIVVDYIAAELEKRKIDVARLYADNFLTGFWAGFSITLLLDYNDRRAAFVDAPCSCTLWPQTPSLGMKRSTELWDQQQPTFPEMGPMLTKTERGQVEHAVITACKAIILCESVLNTMHFFGNYGTKLRIGAEAVLQAAVKSQLHFSRPFNLLIEISEILIAKLPGVTGAMYGCLFEGAARSFLRSPLTTVAVENWSEAMDEALKTLRAYTNAKGGIVSLALSLIPVVSAIHGPYIRLPQRANRNPILCALDSLRQEIEQRVNQGSDEKESLLKNQLDVESYALIIWLHAIYSSVYWKISPSDMSLSTASPEESGSSKKSRSSTSSTRRGKISTLPGINKSLEFIGPGDQTKPSFLSGTRSKPASESSKTSQEGKIFT